MKSRRAARRSSAAVRRLSAASDAASSQRRRVGKKTIAGSRWYEPSATNKLAGGISGMRSFILEEQSSCLQFTGILPVIALDYARASDTLLGKLIAGDKNSGAVAANRLFAQP